MMKTMRALEAASIGEPVEVLRLVEKPVPQPGPAQVLLRILASPVHPSDLHMIRGRFGVAPPLPAVFGTEGVGVVEAVGSAVVDRRVGDRVIMLGVAGTWQEYVAVDAGRVAPIPNAMDTSTAAQLITNPLAALVLVTRELCPAPGEWVAQSAAGSVVGKIVIQLSQRLGFKTINVVRRKAAVDEIRALGGTAVICSEEEDVHSRILELTAGAGVTKALDCVTGRVGADIAQSMAPGGTMIVYGALATHRQTDADSLTLPLFARSLIYGTQTIRGWFMPQWAKTHSPAEFISVFTDLVGRVAKGDIVVPAGQPFALEQAGDALRVAEAVARGPKPLFEPALVRGG